MLLRKCTLTSATVNPKHPIHQSKHKDTETQRIVEAVYAQMHSAHQGTGMPATAAATAETAAGEHSAHKMSAEERDEM
jgi:hypothetical protein